MTTLARPRPSSAFDSIPRFRRPDVGGAASTEGLRSSGTSPGDPREPGDPDGIVTLHLVGVGKVGRAFLRQLAGTRTRLVAVTDSSGSVFEKGGLDAARLAAHKEQGRPVSALPGAQEVRAELAADLVRADVLVDAAPSDPSNAEADLARCRSALRAGSAVALAGKSALALGAGEIAEAALAGRVGFDAALGGTGATLLAELDFLRHRTRSIALVANASSTAILEAFEEGLSFAAAIARCTQRGLLEADPAHDLDGTDAAQKLAAVAGIVFGREVGIGQVEREDLHSFPPALAWWRAQRGRTTRLVARAHRSGRLRVGFEELPRSSPLAVPSDRVAYGYELDDGSLRVHVGAGIGPRATARALLGDVERLAAERLARSNGGAA
jgi:homoserine dehydrogenase